MSCLLAGGVSAADPEGFRIDEDNGTGRITVSGSGKPVLVYNFKTIPVPAGVTGQYAVARSDYVHPLYGPAGEVLTRDYSPDHPHHRGIYWAWPEVTWKGEKRDLHALQGVFARPVKLIRKDVTNNCAVVETENVWKWGDTESIVKELARICVASQKDGRRVIDFEFSFEALVDGVTIARRGQRHYGGFNIRLSARSGQKIEKHTDPAGQQARQAWACLTGVPPEGKQPVSVAILQHRANPEYPGDWVDFPNLNWIQPTFPSSGKVFELKKGAPLVLRFRLVTAGGEFDNETLKQLSKEYSEGK